MRIQKKKGVFKLWFIAKKPQQQPTSVHPYIILYYNRAVLVQSFQPNRSYASAVCIHIYVSIYASTTIEYRCGNSTKSHWSNIAVKTIYKKYNKDATSRFIDVYDARAHVVKSWEDRMRALGQIKWKKYQIGIFLRSP